MVTEEQKGRIVLDLTHKCDAIEPLIYHGGRERFGLNNQYQIEGHEGFWIAFCPWCGEKLPKIGMMK